MNAPARDLIPAIAATRTNIWAKNGGIYFGCGVETPADPDRPLAGRDSMTRAQSDPRTSWTANGEENRYSSDRHVLTVGPNGSGKTRKLLLPNLYRLRDWSCVVIDPKGELCAHTAPYLASIPGHQVRIVDPFGVMKEPQYAKLYEKHGGILQSVGLNPMANLKPKIVVDGKEVSNPRFVDAANAIAEALIKTDDSRDPYWPMAAQAVVTGLLLGLALETGPDASLGMVRRMLGFSPAKFAETCKLLIENHGKACPPLAPNLSRFEDYKADNKELGAIMGTALAQTRWLDSPEIQADLKGQGFDATTLKTTPTTVYLILPPEYLASHGTWLRLAVSSILRPLLRSVEIGENTVPVLFMLDEFAQLGHMKIIEDNYALMRGYGIKLWTIWQDLTQAKNLYKDRWESFMANAGIRQIYSPQDLTTRDYLARMSDKRQKWHNTESSSVGLSLKSMPSLNMSSGETRLDDAVFHPHELSALDLDEAVLWDRMMQYHLSITPQPDLLTKPFPGAAKSVAQLYAEARAAIEG
jgi:type IV secretion system protein VirD4